MFLFSQIHLYITIYNTTTFIYVKGKGDGFEGLHKKLLLDFICIRKPAIFCLHLTCLFSSIIKYLFHFKNKNKSYIIHISYSFNFPALLLMYGNGILESWRILFGIQSKTQILLSTLLCFGVL